MVDVWEGEEWYHRPPRHQADSVTIIAAPVSGTKYGWRAGETGAGAELGDQSNVRICSVATNVTWATTQPTPLWITITIDGIPHIYKLDNPVTATNYGCEHWMFTSQANQRIIIWNAFPVGIHAFLKEGKSVKVEIEITWAVTQPTDLTMRVKWAKIP